MLIAAGVIKALDVRSNTNVSGIFQASSYYGALSGSSWLLAYQYINGFPFIDDIISQWDFQDSLAAPGNDIIGTINLYRKFDDVVDKKSSFGFNVTLTDVW
jgi:hypothetical protein